MLQVHLLVLEARVEHHLRLRLDEELREGHDRLVHEQGEALRGLTSATTCPTPLKRFSGRFPQATSCGPEAVNGRVLLPSNRRPAVNQFAAPPLPFFSDGPYVTCRRARVSPPAPGVQAWLTWISTRNFFVFALRAFALESLENDIAAALAPAESRARGSWCASRMRHGPSRLALRIPGAHELRHGAVAGSRSASGIDATSAITSSSSPAARNALRRQSTQSRSARHLAIGPTRCAPLPAVRVCEPPRCARGHVGAPESDIRLGVFCAAVWVAARRARAAAAGARTRWPLLA